MTLLKLLEMALGLVFLFYFLKGLLGKFKSGDLTKALVLLVAWLALVAFNSGLLKTKPSGPSAASDMPARQRSAVGRFVG